MNTLLDCRDIQAKIKNEITKQIEDIGNPYIRIFQVGNRADSSKYVGQKVKQCQDVGIITSVVTFPESITTEVLLKHIKEANVAFEINGIIVQLPLPKHINTRKVLDAISIYKDIDCLNSYNVGLLTQGHPYVEPCTPKGVLRILEEQKVELSGKDVLVIGRSEIVGKPLSYMLTSKDATVTLAHSKTTNLQDKINKADIIIIAIGKAKSVKCNNKNAIIIDVGINFDENGRLIGDFNHEESTFKLATKVPNGVGALTTAMVCYNTLELTAMTKEL